MSLNLGWKKKWTWTESNCRRGDLQSPALPTELHIRNIDGET